MGSLEAKLSLVLLWRPLFLFLLVMSRLLSSSHGDVGTAAQYSPSYLTARPTAGDEIGKTTLGSSKATSIEGKGGESTSHPTARPTAGDEIGKTTLVSNKAASIESKGEEWTSHPNPCTTLPIFDPNHCH
ncbi:uncharacterized protein LOC110653983 isoform X3 [Hevea brasiliensis]|uniref:uncharacterized protein LOC110653983 isoform X3 n=1 Tax=Hevea brasiliensis TaxID=3981 RepID=UPI0025D449BB|nr:uncharacterized protein LOC110653983 isoform X3 [Hevea brasiliensis]